MKFFVLFVAIFAMLSATYSQPGAEIELKGPELYWAKGWLSLALARVPALGGPSYSVVEVTQVTRQIVAGILNRYKAVLRDDKGKKNCSVKLLQTAVGDIGIMIECENEPPFIHNFEMLQ